MKKSIISALLLALACGASGFWLGQYREHHITNSLIEGTFINNLAALESLRAGDLTTTTRKLEIHVFLYATFLLNDPAPEPHQVIQIFRQQLVTYRQSYRTNQSEWTPMEQKLEKLLTTSK